VTVAEVRALVKTALSGDDLQAVVNREEEELVRRFGPHYAEVDGEEITVSETHYGDGGTIWLNRTPKSIVTVTEYSSLLPSDTGSALTTSHYYLDPMGGALVRGSYLGWGRRVVVEYVPEDDNALRKSVLIDLVRLALNTMPFQSESRSMGPVSNSRSMGEGGATAARENIYRRLVGVRV
jgi:hypothetical protein